MTARWVPGVPHCHAAEPGTFGHECGKTATWIGTKVARGHTPGTYGATVEALTFRGAFCAECKAHGFEAKGMETWEPIGPTTKLEGVYA